jgi:hypothetical protein
MTQSSKRVFALSKEDLTENVMLISGWKKNYYLKKLVASFMNGYLRFDNQVRNLFDKLHLNKG